MTAPGTIATDVEAFLRTTGMRPTTFGLKVANDAQLVANLRAGRQPRAATRAKLVAFMRDHQAEATLWPPVKLFLSATGMDPVIFGVTVCGDPHLVARLACGASVDKRVYGATWQFMAAKTEAMRAFLALHSETHTGDPP